jgi:Type IV pili methyl-accepting chemotaxis transducer N-term
MLRTAAHRKPDNNKQNREANMGTSHTQLNFLHPSSLNRDGPSGEVFSTAINRAGHRRFLSQRVVLYLVLASNGDTAALAAAGEALKGFTEAHTQLMNGGSVLRNVASPAIEEAYFGPQQGDARIRAFIKLAEQTIAAIRKQEACAGQLLNELVSQNTALLDIVNNLTGLYEVEAKRHATTMRTQLHGLVEDIKSIARHARVVSMNAQVIAGRAGDAGREFTVVARELSTVIGEMDKLVEMAMKDAAR